MPCLPYVEKWWLLSWEFCTLKKAKPILKEIFMGFRTSLLQFWFKVCVGTCCFGVVLYSNLYRSLQFLLADGVNFTVQSRCVLLPCRIPVLCLTDGLCDTLSSYFSLWCWGGALVPCTPFGCLYLSQTFTQSCSKGCCLLVSHLFQGSEFR